MVARSKPVNKIDLDRSAFEMHNKAISIGFSALYLNDNNSFISVWCFLLHHSDSIGGVPLM